MSTLAAYYDDGWVKLLCGNALEKLDALPPGVVHCCVTSPPYWGLRKYAGEQDAVWVTNECGAWRGAFGLEPTPEMYVEHSIELLRAIKRVLRSDGVCFWNIGDSYATHNSGGKGYNHNFRSAEVAEKEGFNLAKPRAVSLGLKEKDLCLIPFRVALAAQADGWWIRSIIIWNKANPMPESVKDRPTESHEYILMLTKSARYYWDMEAVREPIAESTIGRGPVDFGGAKGRAAQFKPDDPNFRNGTEQWGRTFDYRESCPNGRNLRSVWTFPTEPYAGAHFATFPTALVKCCILAATSEKGACPKCGKPWVRITKPTKEYEGALERLRQIKDRFPRPAGDWHSQHTKDDNQIADYQTIGWRPGCKCGESETVPCVVLDPFAGSGTVGQVAKELGRKAILIDVSEQYCGLARERVQAVSLPMRI